MCTKSKTLFVVMFDSNHQVYMHSLVVPLLASPRTTPPPSPPLHKPLARHAVCCSGRYQPMLCMQFYARGMFASPAIGWCSARRDAGLLRQLQKGAWALSAVLHSSLDWPIRRLSQGKTSCSKLSHCKHVALKKMWLTLSPNQCSTIDSA